MGRISHLLRTRVCHWSGWKPEPITEVAWNAQQYAALKKFHVKRGADGLWHITSQYTTAKESTEHLVSDVLNYGYWDIPLVKR